MTTASSAARIAWLACNEHRVASSEPALDAWESLDGSAQARLAADAEIALTATSAMGEYFGLWCASRIDDGWTLGAPEGFGAKTSPLLTGAEYLTDVQVARVTLWHSVCRAYGRSLP